MDAMSKTLNEMVHAIVDYCGTITRAADEIGVHYNTLDRLLKDETATAQTGTMEKIEAIYEEIASVEEEPKEELEEKIEKLEVGKTYEISVPNNTEGFTTRTLRGTVKGEYRHFYHLDDNGANITVLKNDLINDRTTVREIDGPEEVIVEKPVEELEEITEEPAEEEATEEPTEAAPKIEGETVAERLNSCFYTVERCNRMIAAGEKAKKDKAAILPLMDEIYKEFRG